MNRFFVRGLGIGLAVAGLALAASAGTAGKEMVVNGSFELPDLGAPGLYGGGGDSWTGSTFGPRLVNGNIDDNNGVPYGATPFGVQYLVLAGISPTGVTARDSQVVNGFVTGKQYQFTVYAADLDGMTNPKLQITFDDGAGTTYFTKKIALPVGGPYKKKIGFQKIQGVFTSPVTGSMSLSLANPVVPRTGESPGLVAVDSVSIVATGE